MPQRLRALDVLRGIAVAGMIVVNCSGSDDVFAPFLHSDWNGITLADLVFPCFLFVAGFSLALSIAARRARGGTREEISRHVIFRAAVLFALGLLVNFIIFRGPHGPMRWPGVPQRIAICVAVATIALLFGNSSTPFFLAAALAVGYWALLKLTSAPGFPRGTLTAEGNFASWIDKTLLGRHMMTPRDDPEGLLSTLGAMTTTLIGVCVGVQWMARKKQPTPLILFLWGCALAAVGWIWSFSVPFNKRLWTSSYAVFTAGVCLCMLAACMKFMRSSAVRKFDPIESLGRHALAAYILTGLVYGIMEFVDARLANGTMGSLKLRINELLFLSWLSPRAASLTFALCFTALAAACAAGYDAWRSDA